jgi:hypothetical protein
MVKTIYKVEWKGDYNRIDGIFVAERDEMDKILRVNPMIKFGKIGANNSELILHPKNFVIKNITEDLEIIEIFSKHSMETGCNLFNMWETQKIEKKNKNLR